MKVGIIGAGMVGATAAYAMVMRGIGREIVLVDLNRERAEAEADDIRHAVPFSSPFLVHAGDYADLAGCRVVVITAGANQKPGETRLELLGRNAAIFRKIVPAVIDAAPQAILLVTTNPVDVLTHLASQIAAERGIPEGKVFGSGTTLDTARFRSLLGQKLGIDSQHIHAYVVGEHGDSEVLTWSLAAVGGIPLEEFCRDQNVDLCGEERQVIEKKVRNAAYTIIEGKGSTYYGIGGALARIVEAILKDQRAVLTVCYRQKEVQGVEDVTISMPFLVGGQGILSAFPLPIGAEEADGLKASALVVRKAIDELG
jgi:L-lactate dehydrogenase